jgi:hypothetical protein
MVFKHTLIKIALGWDTSTTKKTAPNKQTNNESTRVTPTLTEDAMSRQRLQPYSTTAQPPRFSEHFDSEPFHMQNAVQPRAFIDGGRWA